MPQNTTSKNNRQMTKWEKVFAVYIADKELRVLTYKELLITEGRKRSKF